MMLLAICSLSFVGCCVDITDPQIEADQQKPEPVPPTPGDELTFSNEHFKIEIEEPAYSSFSFVVTPTDLNADYICMLYDAETVEEFTKDEYLVATLYQEFTSEARTKGKTLEEYMPEIVDRGILESRYTGLAPESDYYVILFGVDSANGYVANTELLKAKVTTADRPKVNVSFDIETVVSGNSATFKVTPSDPEIIWYFYTVPSSAYNSYTDPNGDYKMDDQDFIIYCLQMQIGQLSSAGYGAQDIINALFHKGALALEASSLNANMDYTNLVAAFDITENGDVTIISDVTTSTYRTGDANSEELTFDITVEDVTANRAAIKIVPSSKDKTFCWMCAEWDGKKSAEEIMNEIVGMYGGAMNNGAMLYTGVQDYTGGPGSSFKYKVDSPDTDYYVIAFGYAGGITTEPEMVTFRTLPAPPADQTTFTMSATEISPYGFKLGVNVSEVTTYYYMDVMSPADYNRDELVTLVNEGIQEMLKMQQMYNPDFTIAQILSSYYYSGNTSANIGGLYPETTVMGVIMAIDHITGEVVKVHEFDPLATTLALGSVNPTVKCLGNFSGDEENGAVFGKPAATKGKAITAIEYADFDGARTLFSTMVGDDVTNVNQFSDSELWKLTMSLWNTVKKTSPYSFYVTEWDAPMTALAYATDSNGTPGSLGRCYTMATVENKGNIEDLKKLVEKANAGENASASALSKSMVIGDQPMGVMSLDIIEQESVVAPVAEVNAVEARPVVTLPIMNSDYIRPFFLHE